MLSRPAHPTDEHAGNNDVARSRSCRTVRERAAHACEHRHDEARHHVEADAVPSYAVKIDDGRLFVSETPVTKRTRGEHQPHPVTRRIERAPGPVRVVGISTTNMDVANPRYSTSDALLAEAIQHATTLGCETQRGTR
jgi:hypothetical protein